MNKGLKLKVAEAHQDDVNKGIARVDSSFMRQLGVNAGDVICIKGERETLAIVDRAYPSDLGLEIIRMDGTLRKNAKISVGDQIDISKKEIKEASKVVLVPLQEFQAHPSVIASLKKSLYRKPVVEGDIIAVSGNGTSDKRQSFSSNNPFAIDLFNAIERDFLGFNLGSMKFKVQSAKPDGFMIIGPQTVIEISSKNLDEDETIAVSYEDIGGLRSQLEKVRELVELPLKHPEIFTRLGIDAPKGILLYGSPGTGKTLLARAIANETEASFFSINAPEIVNKYYGESEKKLRELFDKAEKESPSIIFIDEIDAIAVKRDEVQGETEKRIVAQLLTVLDGLKKNKKIVVIAATNRPDALDEALRRPGRFDRELEIGIPKEEDRLEILKIHTRGMPLELPVDFKSYEIPLKNFEKKQLSDQKDSSQEEGERISFNFEEIRNTFNKDKFEGLKLIPDEIVANVKKKSGDKILKKIAKFTHGFVGADLEALVKEAAFNVLRRNFPNLNKDTDKISSEVLSKLEIREEDFKEALKNVKPSAMREFLVEIPNIHWNQIGGLANIKQSLTEMIEWPLSNPEAFKRLGIKAPKGILLYGPPGTGKTLLAKAVATETSSNFIYVKGPEIINKYVGESEKMVRKLFEKARQNSPSILFFDEMDAIAATRLGGDKGKSSDSVVNQILTEMDGIEDLINVKVIAATNRPGLIDPALLRPGRFDKLVLVDVPDFEARKSILGIYLKETPVEDAEKVIEDIAAKTEGYVGADLEAVVREAGLITLREDIKSEKIALKDFEEALDVIKPSINQELRKHYQEIEKEMKSPKRELESLSMSSYM